MKIVHKHRKNTSSHRVRNIPHTPRTPRRVRPELAQPLPPKPRRHSVDIATPPAPEAANDSAAAACARNSRSTVASRRLRGAQQRIQLRRAMYHVPSPRRPQRPNLRCGALNASPPQCARSLASQHPRLPISRPFSIRLFSKYPANTPGVIPGTVQAGPVDQRKALERFREVKQR